MQNLVARGITRKSMRSSKSVGKKLKQRLSSHNENADLNIIRKSGAFKKNGIIRKRFKDSIKLKKAHLKGRLNQKNCKAKATRKIRCKNKENNNGRILKNKLRKAKLPRRPFSNLEMGNISRKPRALPMGRLPFSNLVEDLTKNASPVVEKIALTNNFNRIESKNSSMQIEVKENDKQVTQFYTDIFNYITSKEARVEPKNYFYKSYFPSRVRTLYINWLIKMHKKFDLTDQTYFLAVNLFDRFLAASPVKKEQLKLLTCATLLISSKYEEILFNELRDYQIMANYEFSQVELLDMEGLVLSKLDFKIFQTCHISVVEIIRKHYYLGKHFTTLALYVLKLCTIDPILCFHDSAHLTITVAHFIIKSSFIYVKDNDLKNYLRKKSINIEKEIKLVIKQNSRNRESPLRKKIFEGFDGPHLRQLESNCQY